MDKVLAFAKEHKLFVIEDNAEAFGGVYKGRKTGTIGDIATAKAANKGMVFLSIWITPFGDETCRDNHILNRI